jgi:aryl-alcohol dehydrogenase-like predicted oxidoreductase
VASRLALGTVQFGLAYGIANESGQVSVDEAARILACARAAGLDTLDTAIGYGESEQRLGEVGVGDWRVISKLPPLAPLSVSAADLPTWVDHSVRGSIERLRISRLGGVLMHRSGDLLEHPQVYAALRALKERGLADKIGVSIYHPEELEPLWERYALDLVQAPFNVLDRRLATTGWLTRLHDAGVEVHTRSAFLQGLLVMEPSRRPSAFDRWSPIWTRWREWLAETGHTALEASLAFATSTPGIDRVIIGVDNVRQLREVLAASHANVRDVPDDLACMDLELISPVAWREL